MSVTQFGDHDELVKALQRITESSDGDDGYLTCDELSDMTGMSRSSLQKRMKLLYKNGKIDIRQVVRQNISGSIMKVPGYRLAHPRATKSSKSK